MVEVQNFSNVQFKQKKNRERDNLYLCLVDFLTILAPTFLSSQLMNRRKVWLFPITGKTLSDSNRKNPDSIQKRYILNIIEVGKEIVYKEKGLNPKKK